MCSASCSFLFFLSQTDWKQTRVTEKHPCFLLYYEDELHLIIWHYAFLAHESQIKGKLLKGAPLWRLANNTYTTRHDRSHRPRLLGKSPIKRCSSAQWTSSKSGIPGCCEAAAACALTGSSSHDRLMCPSFLWATLTERRGEPIRNSTADS